MDFDFDTGRIYGGLATLDVSANPPLGTGPANVLDIIANGAVILPKGTAAQRPAAAGGTDIAGMLRYNTSGSIEYFDGTNWITLSVGGGSVTSINATSSTAALTVVGGPITSSGTFTFDLDDDLTAIAALTGTGFAVRSAADTWVQRAIVGTAGTIVVSNGDGVAGAPTITLDTLGTPVTASFVKITTDTFGRVSATTPVTQTDITTLVDTVYVNVLGDAMTGSLTMNTGTHITLTDAPVNGTDATNKDYVDALANGLSWKQAVLVGSTTDIDLTTGGLLTIDGVIVIDGARVLVKAQTDNTENGIYIAATGAWVRSQDMDGTTPLNEVNGAAVFIEQGTTQADTAWVQTQDVQIIGTDPIVWSQFSSAGGYSAGNGLVLTGSVFSLSAPVSIANGGTALSTTPGNGQLLIGNGVDYTLAGLTSGTGITITPAAGSITIDNSGVLSVTGTTNQITASPTAGNVVLTLPSTLIVPGSLEVTTTFQVNTFTPNSMLYVTTAGQVVSTAALTDGQILIGDTGGVPVAGTVTGGTGITVTNGAGTITIDVDKTEMVTSFSAGTTGFTPSSPAFGDVVLAGTLNVANGGTGLTSLGGANTVLGVDAAGTAAEYKTITAGTGISVTNGVGVITVANTGVTSVGLTDGSVTPIFTVTGSPVTATGSFTNTLNTQAANVVFAGPQTGTAAEPTFRALVLNDLSSALKLYTENPGTVVSPSATGTNSVAIGSGSSATAVESFAEGSGAVARIYGQKAFANGFTTTAGEAQAGLYVLRNVTDDNTVTELFLDGTSEQIVLPDNSLFTFEVLVAGRRTDAVGGGAGYRFIGVARKDATSGSVTFVGTPSKTVLGETNIGWDSLLTVDTSTGAISIKVLGEAAKDIKWTAVVRTSEVTN